jgi:predicted RNase H-like nuclease (RuvC/YqgF family)
MSNADKTTIKLPVNPGKAVGDVAQSNLTEDQNNALELVKRNAQLREEKNKSLELQMTIEQLREDLKGEQAKIADMAKKTAMLEAKVKELSEQGTNVKKVAELEAKVKELTEALGKISGIASTGKAG